MGLVQPRPLAFAHLYPSLLEHEDDRGVFVPYTKHKARFDKTKEREKEGKKDLSFVPSSLGGLACFFVLLRAQQVFRKVQTECFCLIFEGGKYNNI